MLPFVKSADFQDECRMFDRQNQPDQQPSSIVPSRPLILDFNTPNPYALRARIIMLLNDVNRAD